MIEIEAVSVEENRIDYQTSPPTQGLVITKKYTEEGVKKAQAEVKKRLISPTTEMGGGFAFYKHVTYARSQFATEFPQFKLVRKNYEYLIIQKWHLERHIYYNSGYIQIREGVYGYDYNSKEPKISLAWADENTKFLRGIAEQLNQNPQLQLVYLEDLYTVKAETGTELTDVLFDSLDKMLGSSEEDIKVGLNILCAVDYDKYSNEISFLLFKHWDNKAACVTKDVRMKTLLQRIEKDYPTYKYARYNRLGYLKEMVETCKDKYLMNKITDYALNTKGLILSKYEEHKIIEI